MNDLLISNLNMSLLRIVQGSFSMNPTITMTRDKERKTKANKEIGFFIAKLFIAFDNRISK